MTPEEYATLQTFKKLPVYDDDDSRCKNLLKISNTAYTGEVLEADTLDLAQEYLAQEDWVPKGAIRYKSGGEESIFPVFWKKRPE